MADDRTSHRKLRDLVAIQRIEGNPLSLDEIAMFEAFEREGLTGDQRRARIKARLLAIASNQTA